MYLHKDIETISKDDLYNLQLNRVNNALQKISSSPKYNEYYRSKKYNVNTISSLEEIKEIPFTTKEDLRGSYPDGFLTVTKDDVIRIHSSSGTTGRPTVIFHTAKDIDNWSDIIARCLYMVGINKNDTFQNMMSYGLFSGGFGLHYGAEKLGCMIIPTGAGNTERQLKFMKDYKTTVIHITPSYALHLASLVRQKDMLDELSLRIGLMGAEPYSESTRLKIEDGLNINVYNCYGLSEMNGPGVAFECKEKEGMHVWEDNYYIEIVNPATGETLPDGEEGEVILSAINREAMPLLRYRTRDLAFLYPEKCRCGRTHRKLSRIKGRTDDMIIIGGVNFFPSQIEDVLMKFPEVGSNYHIILWTKGALDKLTVKIEVNPELFIGDLKHLTTLKETITNRLKNEILINPIVELIEPGSLPESQGKAKRIFDNRTIDK